MSGDPAAGTVIYVRLARCCRLGLEDAVPDYPRFRRAAMVASATATRFAWCLRGVVERCMKEGLVGGEGFAIDASLIEADANRSRSMAREEAADLRDPRHAQYASIWRHSMRKAKRAVLQRQSCRRSRCAVDGRGWPGVLRLLHQLLD